MLNSREMVKNWLSSFSAIVPMDCPYIEHSPTYLCHQLWCFESSSTAHRVVSKINRSFPLSKSTMEHSMDWSFILKIHNGGPRIFFYWESNEVHVTNPGNVQCTMIRWATQQGKGGDCLNNDEWETGRCVFLLRGSKDCVKIPFATPGSDKNLLN